MYLPNLEGAVAMPLDLPRAEAYLVSSSQGQELEDRFDSFELWHCASIRGRWRDAAGNQLLIARIDSLPPDDAPGAVRTRKSFRSALAAMDFDPKERDQRDAAVGALSPVEVDRGFPPRRAQRKNFDELLCYPPVDDKLDRVLVYVFRPHSPERTDKPAWHLVALAATPKEDMAEVRARFDEDFLDRISVPSLGARRSLAQPSPRPGKKASEAELLRADLRASVANYDEWACTEAEDVLVLDDLDVGLRRSLVSTITNQLPRLRRAYARSVPSSLSGTNAIACVRVFRNRQEYLAYVGIEQNWTAALWSPEHRELVLHHPERGNEALLRTVWHESFHQYLAYAGSMIQSSPWFNEGHAQLFEYSHYDSKGKLVFEREAQAAAYVHEYAQNLAEMLPTVFEMDYDEFYGGKTDDVQARYWLAWSIAYFLEVGAPKLRFQPYANFRADYMKALVGTRSMREATAKAFGNEKGRDEFVAAWLSFWREN